MTHNVVHASNKSDVRVLAPPEPFGHEGKRDELARQLIAMFGHSAPNLARTEIDEFDHLFVELNGTIALSTRAFLASRLADIPNAPHGITVQLALDTINVARPILLKSVILNDEDLLLICQERGSGHMTAIAQRPYVSSAVSDILVFRGDDIVRQKVAENEGVSISPRGFSRLAGQARSDPSMERILIGRPDLPGVAVHILVKFGSKALREQLEPSLNEAKIQGTGSINSRARELEELDFALARARVDQLSQQGLLGDGLLMRFVAEEKLAEAMVMLSRIIGVSLNDVKTWYLEPTPETLLVAARAYGIDSRAIFGVLGLGRWRLTLDARTRQSAIQRYQSMPKTQAVKTLGVWRKARHAQSA